MATTTEEAARILAEGGVPVTAPDDATLPLPRREICRRLLESCRDPALPDVHWNTPLLSLYFEPLSGDEDTIDEFVWMAEEELFGLVYIEGEGASVATFGDLVLLLEARLRDLWRDESRAACPSQTVFYELRRIISACGGYPSDRRSLRPKTPLRDCVASDTTEAVSTAIVRRFGVSLTDYRVFGRLEFGATWLALWFLFILFWMMVCLQARWGMGALFTGVFTGAVIMALLLTWASRLAWNGRPRTIGDMVRRILRERPKAQRRLQLDRYS